MRVSKVLGFFLFDKVKFLLFGLIFAKINK